ncbi:hypothetical protein TNCV_599361 [Trichonephila clavipes]|nr:hypothetical protein TNCV_599361 [Trichonephila clavipes]
MLRRVSLESGVPAQMSSSSVDHCLKLRGARVQRNSSTMMRVWKQRTDEHRTTRKTGSRRRKVTLARDDRYLLCMMVNERTASSWQLTAR